MGAVGSPGESVETSAGLVQEAVQAGRVEAEAMMVLMEDSYS